MIMWHTSTAIKNPIDELKNTSCNNAPQRFFLFFLDFIIFSGDFFETISKKFYSQEYGI